MTKLATLMASLALSQIAPPTVLPQTVFRSSSDVVIVSANVKRGGTPLRGLRATDFALMDNGVAQDVELIAADAVPLDLTLVLTGDPPDRAVAGEFRRSLEIASVARRLLGPSDRLRVVSACADVRGGFVASDAQLPPLLGGRETLGGVALTDALFFAMALPVPPTRRHVVVAFTDGWDTWSILDTETLVPIVENSDALLSAAIWNGPQSGLTSGGGIKVTGFNPSVQRQRERSFRTLESAVAASGGSVLNIGDSNATKSLELLLQDFRESYILHYSPRGVSAPGWHTIVVSLRQPAGAVVKARKGYFVVEPPKW